MRICCLKGQSGLGRRGDGVSWLFPFGKEEETAFLGCSHSGRGKRRRFLAVPVREGGRDGVSWLFPCGKKEETASLGCSRAKIGS